MQKVSKLEVVGVIFSVVFGSMLHFLFAWSRYSKVVALIAAVNESTWEHLKLGFWPLLLWASYEYFVFGKKYNNFIFAKACTVFSFCISVPLIFYSYVAVLGKNYLFLDISTFLISVILSQFLGYKILKIKRNMGLNNFGLLLMASLLIAFLSLSFYPPKNFLFKDPVSNGYGIIVK